MKNLFLALFLLIYLPSAGQLQNASNGLNVVGNNVKFGGTLIENTNLDVSSYQFVIKKNSINYLSIFNNGNIGIGAGTDAGYKLQINGSIYNVSTNNFFGKLATDQESTETHFGHFNAATFTRIKNGPYPNYLSYFLIENSNTFNGIQIISGNDGKVAGLMRQLAFPILVLYGPDHSQGEIQFSFGPQTNLIGKFFRNGNFRIGQQPYDAGEKLQVEGMIGILNSSGVRIGVVGYSNSDLSYKSSIANANQIFFTNPAGIETEAMRLTASGNLGIGVSNPTAKLSVNGDITAKKLKVTTTGFPDYVFDPAYPLLPLEKLKSFIKKNKHLPEIPSAREVEKAGLDVGENQVQLLKKIEELTLYIIQQNSAIQDQQKSIKGLQAEIRMLKKHIH